MFQIHHDISLLKYQTIFSHNSIALMRLHHLLLMNPFKIIGEFAPRAIGNVHSASGRLVTCPRQN